MQALGWWEEQGLGVEGLVGGIEGVCWGLRVDGLGMGCLGWVFGLEWGLRLGDGGWGERLALVVV